MLSIIYPTARHEPHFEWFCDSLVRQFRGNVDAQIIFVDHRLWYDEGRRGKLHESVKERFEYTHVPPKPSVWCGPTRLTSKDYHALCNARNTGIAHANGDYLAIVDDCSVLGAGWLQWIEHAMENGIAIGGSQQKVKQIHVDNGHIKWYVDAEMDSRGFGFSYNGQGKYKGGALYGSNFGVPMEWVLAVNGFDEVFDGRYKTEDVDFTVRLKNEGYTTYYNPMCYIIESSESHKDVGSMANWNLEFNTQANGAALDKTIADKRSWTVGNDFNLKELREKIQSGGDFPIPTKPTKDWREGKLLKDM
jgi:hypothetical protein